MRSKSLQLTLTGRSFALTPLPAHLESHCTAAEPCQHPATHRLLSRATADVNLLCDSHTIEWAREHGCNITSAGRQPEAAAGSARG